MGMGMGFVLAQQMGGMMNPQAQQQGFGTPHQVTPPPIPMQVMYHYASNGQQMGPVSIDKLKELFASRTINKDALVWKQGMQNWTPLKDVEELKSFLGGSAPPPLPTA